MCLGWALVYGQDSELVWGCEGEFASAEARGGQSCDLSLINLR